METRLIMVGIVLAVLVATPAAATGGQSPPTTLTSTSVACDQGVGHDAFRSSDAVQVVNETGEATSSADNTEVRVEDVTGFIRLHASNPNGYCVAFTVEISKEIVAPADLGAVDSLDENTSADWRAVQNLSSGALYTQVTFVLPPGGEATFAPSTVRVESLSWTGKARNASSGLWSSLFGEDDLEERQYDITPENGEDAITIPLTSDDGRTVEDWQATYTVDGETRPITQDANAPVYYTETDEGVTFHFNDPNATVHFTANPTWVERRGHDVDTYTSGWEAIGDLLPFTATLEVGA
jgi:hypothetical protein